MPMKKEQQKKGGMATCAPGGDTLSVLFLLTITLLLLNHTTHALECYETGKGRKAKPTDNILLHFKEDGTNIYGTYCFMAYNLAGSEGHPTWERKQYTYVAGGDNKFNIDVCSKITERGNGTCEVVNTTNTFDKKEYWRLDFACCCDTPYTNSKGAPIECNDLSRYDAMNPQLQFEIQLNATDQQICRVGYPPDQRIDSCTRHTGLNETQSPSKCRSVLQGRQQTLGCAHDGVSDRCSWTSTYPQKSGVCREIPGGGGIECCCEGAYCNGLYYMDLACRSKITAPNTSNKFIYGDGKCKAVWPPNTPTVDTTDGPANKGGNSGNQNGAPNTETSTGTTGSDHTMLIVGVIAAVVVVVIIIIVVGLVIFFWYRRKKARKSKGSESKPKVFVPAHIQRRIEMEKENEYFGLRRPEVERAIGNIHETIRDEGMKISDDDDAIYDAVCPLMCFDSGAKVSEQRSEVPKWFTFGDTGFLGNTYFGKNDNNVQCMLKRYNMDVCVGKCNATDEFSDLAKKYIELHHLNLLKIITIKHTKRHPDSDLLIVSERANMTLPLSFWLTFPPEMAEVEGSLDIPNQKFLQNYAIAAQVTKAVTYLTSEGFACYNLKCNNIIVGFHEIVDDALVVQQSQRRSARLVPNGIPLVKELQLTDFAFPKMITEYVERDKEKALERSSVEHYPPEVRFKYEFNEHTSSYMCAMVMIEIWGCGEKPFASIPKAERKRLYDQSEKEDTITPPLPKSIPKGSYIELLIKRMMDKDPKRRPLPDKAAHVLRHIYINYDEKTFGPKTEGLGSRAWARMVPSYDDVNPNPSSEPPSLPYDLFAPAKPAPETEHGATAVIGSPPKPSTGRFDDDMPDTPPKSNTS